MGGTPPPSRGCVSPWRPAPLHPIPKFRIPPPTPNPGDVGPHPHRKKKQVELAVPHLGLRIKSSYGIVCIVLYGMVGCIWVGLVWFVSVWFCLIHFRLVRFGIGLRKLQTKFNLPRTCILTCPGGWSGWVV